MKKYAPLIGLIVVLQALAFLTSYFVTESAVHGWYQDIHKSPLNPPDWLFAPVWTVLYTLLGIALWRLWRVRYAPGGRRALAFFLIQLAGNYAWSFVFFGMGNFAAAFILLCVIDAFTLACMITALRTDKTVTFLLLPYIAWISFATYLTFDVMRLN